MIEFSIVLSFISIVFFVVFIYFQIKQRKEDVKLIEAIKNNNEKIKDLDASNKRLTKLIDDTTKYYSQEKYLYNKIDIN
jgi:uncharacterized protein YpmS